MLHLLIILAALCALLGGVFGDVVGFEVDDDKAGGRFYDHVHYALNDYGFAG